ncbi:MULTISPECIES: D-alanine--D-alanine ligase [unclassified Paludibacterium]|uniref:D-alanine--D-alanine ligase n=1 Tax=unclassified Paludibacterium TaxID=2618429 RepID=UPI001C03FFAC|nr:D-alanine--D-alanine ligase [Paludibacterium sp. B53371]BEV73601.1 D-alanine--D-alanine ligase [Paludibacterium sp. THUN1379]
MSKLRVGLIFGGQSAEHEVSLQSARNIANAMDPARFDVLLIGIDKQGNWHVSPANDYLLHADDPARIAFKPSGQSVSLLPGAASQQLRHAASAHPLAQIDVVFPIVHGTLGEDGSLQGLLRMANLPFVGCGVLGSAVCMDKDVAKRLLRDAGLPVAPFVCVTRANRASLRFADVEAKLGLPLFVKPANQGSSVGVSKVHDASEFDQAIDQALRFDHKVLIEQTIVGREIECAVLGNDQPRASVCGEIVLSDEFYSYDTKYISDSGARVVAPADLPDDLHQRIRDIAVQAFQALDCRGMARVDVFLTPSGEVIINELNTLPGFTNISMYPKLWEASGLSYRDLISTLIDLALERHHQDTALASTIL